MSAAETHEHGKERLGYTYDETTGEIGEVWTAADPNLVFILWRDAHGTFGSWRPVASVALFPTSYAAEDAWADSLPPVGGAR